MANTLHLDEPLLEDILKAPYFFNGRLLTQEDLTQEQAAQRARRMHLGRALGSGIAYGLEVVRDDQSSSPGDIALYVAPGLAIAPDGDSLNLPERVQLRFSLAPDAGGQGVATLANDFSDCCVPSTATVSIAQTGLHLLVLRAASGKQGLAPVSGLGNEAAPCNVKYRTWGVSFRAVPLTVGVANGDAKYRSAVARECFGFLEPALATLLADPFTGPAPLELAIAPTVGAAPAAGYGKVDDLRAKGQLASCEVPLAVVHLDDDARLDFVDMWPVRRPLVRPPLSRRFWPMGGSDDRRRAEGEAAMLCFAEHAADMIGPGLDTATAASRFAFLPGGGFLPTGGSTRFDAATFFGPSAKAVYDEDFGRLRWLVEEAWRCEPFSPAAGSLPPITYYVFAQAAGRWVFFLRRRTEVLEIPVEEPGLSPPESEPEVEEEEEVEEEVEDETRPGLSETGQILVIIPEPRVNPLGKFRVALFLTNIISLDEPFRKLVEIDRDEAERVLEKALNSEVNVLFGRRQPALSRQQLKSRLADARCFIGKKLPPRQYALLITDPLKRTVFRERVSISAGHTLVVDAKATPR